MRIGIDAHLDILVGDVRTSLRELPDDSIDCVVTSPPYYSLRDYAGPPSVWGGERDCEHEWSMLPSRTLHGNFNEGMNERTGRPVGLKKQEVARPKQIGQGAWCVRCDAWRGQLGLEPSPAFYIDHLVEVFREVRRVLAPHGTCWLNLGDSFANDGKWGGSTGGKHVSGLHGNTSIGRSRRHTGLKPKDLIQVPARAAIALQDDGWWLRSDIIWEKPNAMPESVTDRPTMSHEHIFLLTKQSRYYYDGYAIRESAEWARWGAQTNEKYEAQGARGSWVGPRSREAIQELGGGTKGARSVWRIATQPFSAKWLGFEDDDHFATFPEELARRCIAAGCAPEVCMTCGRPRERIVERVETGWDGSRYGERAVVATGGAIDGGTAASTLGSASGVGTASQRHRGWTDCDCTGSYRTGVVLDPFLGSGTTAVVARRAGLRALGCEMNERYVEIAAARARSWWKTVGPAAPQALDDGQLDLLAATD